MTRRNFFSWTLGVIGAGAVGVLAAVKGKPKAKYIPIKPYGKTFEIELLPNQKHYILSMYTVGVPLKPVSEDHSQARLQEMIAAMKRQRAMLESDPDWVKF